METIKNIALLKVLGQLRELTDIPTTTVADMKRLLEDIRKSNK